ncbi:MAG: T9SS type A sorting domain-containing protein [Bacteroidetes bacterium]|nr:T9SS type A sorting domain-containing protein [Bacteroidota bacterium]
MKKIILLFAILTFTSIKINAQTVTDFDGNVYTTITIGTQAWTKENLKVTHYRNGDSIPNVADSLQWYNSTSGAYCNYDTNMAAVYGRLYNWYAVQDSRNIAPLGWHVPTFEDWDTLQIFLGYDLVAGGKLKEIGTAHWMSPNFGATDQYGFTALPGGQRADSIYSGTFSEITQQGYWWSSSELDTVYPWGVNISYNSEGMTNWGASTRKSGFSIRLISDLAVGIKDMNQKDYLNIYPNPVKDKIHLVCADNRKMNLEIDNLMGEPVLRMELNERRNEVDISTLAKGMYIIKITGVDWIVQKKMVKE